VDINVDYIWRKPKSTVKKYNVQALKNVETSASFQLEKSFQLELTNRFLPLFDNTPLDFDDFSEAVNTEILETADKITPPVKSTSPQWMQLDTKRAIENKKDVRKKHGDTSSQNKKRKSRNETTIENG
jgi:hypothetical protein